MTHERLIFAKTLFGEARQEGLKGMEAVAAVIMNRLNHALKKGDFWWGNSLLEICLKPFQFSCWRNRETDPAGFITPPADDPLFQMAVRVANRAANGLLPDPTNGATSYHDIDENPAWSTLAVPSAEIGRRLFYAVY